MSEFYGPTFGDAEENTVFPQGDYVVIVEGGGLKKTKNPNEDGSFGYAITPKLRILSAPDDKFINKFLTPWWSFAGWSCFIIPRACHQAGLDEIDSYYNEKHPNYKGEAERPVFLGSEEESYTKVAAHYMTGEMVDDKGREFKCPDGGLLGQTLRVKVGKPNKKNPKDPKTGNITPERG